MHNLISDNNNNNKKEVTIGHDGDDLNDNLTPRNLSPSQHQRSGRGGGGTNHSSIRFSPDQKLAMKKKHVNNNNNRSPMASLPSQNSKFKKTSFPQRLKQREKEKIHDPLAEILQEKILRAHGSMPMPNELTEENWKDADVLIDRFGTFAIKCLYSREWRLREAAVATICEFVLFNTLPEHRLYTFKLASLVTILALSDRVNQVYFQGLKLCKVLYNADTNVTQQQYQTDDIYRIKQTNNSIAHGKSFSQFSSLNFKRSDIKRGIASIMPLLTKHIASDNNKLRRAIEDIGLFLVQQDHVGPEVLVVEHLLAPDNRTVSWRDLAGRLRLLSRVILTLGISKRSNEPPMTLDYIMSRTVEHLQHPNNHVRSAAINVAMACYKFCGGDVERYFGGLRQSLLDLLHAGFLEVEDEKIRENEIKVNTPRTTVKFKDDIEMTEEYNFEDKVEEELDEFLMKESPNRRRNTTKRNENTKNEAIKKIEEELKVAIPKLKIEKESFYSSDDSSDDDLIVIEDDDEEEEEKKQQSSEENKAIIDDKEKNEKKKAADITSIKKKSMNKKSSKDSSSSPKSKYVVAEKEEGKAKDDTSTVDDGSDGKEKKKCVIM